MVLIEARRHSDGADDGTELAMPIGAWTRYDRPAPSLRGYDALLTGTQG
nr:hypothetical protein [Mycolicibacterium conceptionense]